MSGVRRQGCNYPYFAAAYFFYRHFFTQDILNGTIIVVAQCYDTVAQCASCREVAFGRKSQELAGLSEIETVGGGVIIAFPSRCVDTFFRTKLVVRVSFRY